MINADTNGTIVVEVNGQAYNLSNTEQYAKFLMWLTSPDEENIVLPNVFAVASDLPDDYAAKAARYSQFFADFAERRSAKLAELSESLTAEQREAAINKFIATLKGEDK